MTKRRNNTNQNQLEEISTAVKGTKVSARLFEVLRGRLVELTLPDKAIKPTAQEKKRYDATVQRKRVAYLRGLGGQYLAEHILAHSTNYSLQTDAAKASKVDALWKELEAKRLRQIKQLQEEVNRAELSFLAGDSAPAQRLVEKINSLADRT